MKKMLMSLTLFCLLFCVIFTACADHSPSDTSADPAGPSQTSSSAETTEQTSSATEKTTEISTTEYTKPYTVCYTEICETKELITEIPELQEKIDRNDKNQGSDLSYHFQQKVIVSIGDHRDVPYIFDMGGGQYFQKEYVIYPYFAGEPYFSELEREAEYMPTYVYTGTETVVIELNDEILSKNPVREFSVQPVDGSARSRSFDTFEEIYAELSTGKYYVTYLIEIFRNDIFAENGEYLGRESRCIAIAFMVELSAP